MDLKSFYLFMVTIWVFSLPPQASGAIDTSNLVVVSDVDDTLKISHIINNGNYIELIRRSFRSEEFSGMSVLLNQLKKKGADIHYVTATPSIFKNTIISFLHKNIFPNGRSWNRPSLWDDSLKFKFETIKQMILNQPDKEFLLIGDDGQYDSRVFELLRSDPEVGSKIKGSYIHDLYHNAKNPSSTYYASAADLSLHLENRGFLTKSETKNVLKYIHDELSAGNYDALVPSFAQLTPDQIKAYFNNPSLKPNMELSYYRDQIALALARGRPSPKDERSSCLYLYTRLWL